MKRTSPPEVTGGHCLGEFPQKSGTVRFGFGIGANRHMRVVHARSVDDNGWIYLNNRSQERPCPPKDARI